MSILDAIRNGSNRAKEKIDKFGLKPGLSWLAWHFGYGLLHDKFGVDFFQDDSVVSENWDVLIILDACRPDAIESVRSSYNWLPESTTRYSVAGTSSQWMDRTFSQVDDQISDIGYITGNPYSLNHITDSQFKFVDEVWKESWDENAGTIRARPITDRAITASRENKADRLIVHYMQPHFPSVPEGLIDGVSRSSWGEKRMSVWDDIAEGKITKAEAWDAYIANLEYVLDDVQVLLSNIEANDVIITADHGEGFGEQGTFGHGESPFPVLRRVPWIETSAEDTNTYKPETSDETEVSVSVKERLKQLGYK